MSSATARRPRASAGATTAWRWSSSRRASRCRRFATEETPCWISTWMPTPAR
jgi:hypothetical protein